MNGETSSPSGEVRIAEQILNFIMNSTNGPVNYPFLDEVDPIALDLPDYRIIVKEPMWLRKMEEKFHDNCYTNIKEFICDFRLMLFNCYCYNGTASKLGRLAERLEMLFEQKLMLLAPDLRLKTSLQATLSSASVEEELVDCGLGRRRNQNKLFAGNDHRQCTPVRALMEEIEQSRVGGLASSLFQNSGEDEDPVNADSRVNLIVAKLGSWERKRLEERLITQWPEFWNRVKGEERLVVLRKSPEFLESFQFLWLADRFLGLSDCITAVSLSLDQLSAASSLWRRFSMRELEYGFSLDVRYSATVASIFNSLLASNKDRSALLSAAQTLRSRSQEGSAPSESNPRSNDQLRDAMLTLRPPAYDKWELELKNRIDSWFDALRARPNRTPLWLSRRMGVPERFFQVFGQHVNPLESRRLHELTTFKQVLILRSLVENVQRTQENLRISMERHAEWEAIRPVELGRDLLVRREKRQSIQFVYFPQMHRHDQVRIYAMRLPDFSTRNPDWSAEEFIAQNFNPAPSRVMESRVDVVELKGTPVPGPVFYLPRWFPDYLARFCQQRWIRLLSDQQLRLGQLSAAERKKLRLAKRTYKLLPMACMEDLYSAEGKNRLGKFSGKNAKSNHEKAVATANQLTEEAFLADPQLTQTDYYRIRAAKGPYPPDLLAYMYSLLAMNYKKLVLKAKKKNHKSSSSKTQTKMEPVEGVGKAEEDDSCESGSEASESVTSGRFGTEQEDEEEEEVEKSSAALDDEDEAEDEEEEAEEEVEKGSSEEPKQANGDAEKTPMKTADLAAQRQSDLELEDLFSDPNEAYSEDPCFALVAHDLTTLAKLVDETRRKITQAEAKRDEWEEEKDREEAAEEEEKKEEPPAPTGRSRKRAARASVRGSKAKKAKLEAVPKVTVEEEPPEPSKAEAVALLRQLLDALLALQHDVECNHEAVRVDAEKLTRLRVRKDFDTLEAMAKPKSLLVTPPARNSLAGTTILSSPVDDADIVKERAERLQNREKKKEEYDEYSSNGLELSPPRPQGTIAASTSSTIVQRLPLVANTVSVGMRPVMRLALVNNGILRSPQPALQPKLPLARIAPGSPLPLQPKAPVPTQPPKRVYRIQDTLFTEDCVPVKIGPNGELINLAPESVSEDHRVLARQMISRFKNASSSPIPVTANSTTTKT